MTLRKRRVSQSRPSLALYLLLLAGSIALSLGTVCAATKVKLHAYITGRLDDRTLLILDDHIEITGATRLLAQDASGEHPIRPEEVFPGMLVEIEGHWLDKHKFFAEKITVDLREDEKKVRGTAYLQDEPEDASKIAKGEGGELTGLRQSFVGPRIG